MFKPAVAAAALLALASPALAGPGVSVILDHSHNGRARIKVQNPGRSRGHFTVHAMDIDGNQLPATITPSAFYLGRGRERKVRISDLPPTTTHICAAVSASSSLRLQSCSAVTR